MGIFYEVPGIVGWIIITIGRTAA